MTRVRLWTKWYKHFEKLLEEVQARAGQGRKLRGWCAELSLSVSR